MIHAARRRLQKGKTNDRTTSIEGLWKLAERASWLASRLLYSLWMLQNFYVGGNMQSTVTMSAQVDFHLISGTGNLRKAIWHTITIQITVKFGYG